MRAKTFETYLKQLIEKDQYKHIRSVQTFDEAGFTDKPYGLRIEFDNQAAVFIQFVRTSPPGGDDFSKPDYYAIPEEIK